MTFIMPEETGSQVRPSGGSIRRSGRWTFLGPGALPRDPTARQHEQRGRRWLVVSYFLCPCHIPITLALLGAVFGGSTLGAAVTGNALPVGIALTVLYALVLWRGFRQIRIAKHLEANGYPVTCSPDGCEFATAGKPPAGLGRLAGGMSAQQNVSS